MRAQLSYSECWHSVVLLISCYVVLFALIMADELFLMLDNVHLTKSSDTLHN